MAWHCSSVRSSINCVPNNLKIYFSDSFHFGHNAHWDTTVNAISKTASQRLEYAHNDPFADFYSGFDLSKIYLFGIIYKTSAFSDTRLKDVCCGLKLLFLTYSFIHKEVNSSLNLSQCTLAGPVYTGMPLECHWLTQRTPGKYWETKRIFAGYTGTPLEKLSWNSPNWNATGETLNFATYTGTPLEGLWQFTQAPTPIVEHAE